MAVSITIDLLGQEIQVFSDNLLPRASVSTNTYNLLLTVGHEQSPVDKSTPVVFCPQATQPLWSEYVTLLLARQELQVRPWHEPVTSFIIIKIYKIRLILIVEYF